MSLTFSIMLFSASLLAKDLPNIGFPGLSEQRFETQCYGTGGVHFDPKLTKGQNQFTEIPDHPAGGYRTVLAGRLAAGGTEYLIRYDDGPSCDPTFSVWSKDGETALGELGGDHLVLPGNGFLYVIRRSNRSFEGREKWQIRNGELSEVIQSHYYVGLTTKTRSSVALRQTAVSNAPVIAQVPSGEQVTVVLLQIIDGRDWYLVRTPFGLLGWTQDNAYGEDRQFEDLQFFGD